MRLLVVGGAGYIGSHMCKMLAERGDEVVVCDNLSTGHRQAVQWGPLLECSMDDMATLRAVLAAETFDAVLHFAACSLVEESVRDPLKYYQNNVGATIGLLRLMREFGIERFVFSSTAAIFGEPLTPLISETHPAQPLNPYGASKLAVERILADAARAYGLRAVALRYFNAAGADASARIGEAHEPETHLIPKLLRFAAGEGASVKIFGDDYPTEDGTCIRDYVHVNDLCDAHVRALDYMASHGGFNQFNLGNGRGYSVRRVVEAVERVTGVELNLAVGPRRPGDPAVLVASHDKAASELGWTPQMPQIEDIIESAWRWHLQPAYGLPRPREPARAVALG